MVKRRILSPNPLFDPALLTAALEENHINPIWLSKTWNRILYSHSIGKSYEEGIQTVLDTNGCPKAMQALLTGKDFSLMTSTVKEENTSKDGSTTKLVVELQDKQLVESVIMRHATRTTLCVSSQVGCQMGCTFCATGTMGLLGNLHAGEIVEQLLHANKRAKITNIVFMGMGEPLNNYDNVLKAIEMMVDPRLFGLRKTRVTLSTVGVVPYMYKLTKEAPYVTMALSLHAPTQEIRQQIVPAAKAWKMEKLLAALDDHIEKTGRKVLCEYVVIKDVNDMDEVAHELGRVAQGRNVHINLIPYNPTDVPHDYKPPTEEQLYKFFDILRHEYKVFTTVRVEMGQDIAGACGQLALSTRKKGDEEAEAPVGETLSVGCPDKMAGSTITNRGVQAPPSGSVYDIEDLGPAKKTPKAKSSRKRAPKNSAGNVVPPPGASASPPSPAAAAAESLVEKEKRSSGGGLPCSFGSFAAGAVVGAAATAVAMASMFGLEVSQAL